MMKQKYKVVSLFSGGMGLDLGLEQTGRFQVVACVEKEHAFCETIRTNHQRGRLDPGLKIFEGDISGLSPQEILDAIGLKPGEVDLLAGGPPCQSFSTAGKRAATQDPRGTLLWQYLRFIEAIQPKFFLMENVRGLLSAALNHRPIAQRPNKGGAPLGDDEAPGSVIRLFASDLQKIAKGGYHMDCFEVNAVNYVLRSFVNERSSSATASIRSSTFQIQLTVLQIPIQLTSRSFPTTPSCSHGQRSEMPSATWMRTIRSSWILAHGRRATLLWCPPARTGVVSQLRYRRSRWVKRGSQRAVGPGGGGVLPSIYHALLS